MKYLIKKLNLNIKNRRIVEKEIIASAHKTWIDHTKKFRKI